MSDPTGGWAAATTEGFKALRELGGAIAEPIREIMGMASDHLKVVRFERQVRLADRLRAMMREGGIARLERQIPLNTLLPLLEHASLEEDDDLQDVWARMLLNAGDSANPEEVRRAFVSMLAEMTAFDVANLALIEAANPARLQLVQTGYLPNKALLNGQKPNEAVPDPRPDVAVSVGNLVRLGCLTYAPGWDGVSLTSIVGLTDLGKAFVTMCSQRNLQAPRSGPEPVSTKTA